MKAQLGKEANDLPLRYVEFNPIFLFCANTLPPSVEAHGVPETNTFWLSFSGENFLITCPLPLSVWEKGTG